jgi:predicted NAD-dependent protein-ADP-ribosyltransferase YbiA (DUF1768 family)
MSILDPITHFRGEHYFFSNFYPLREPYYVVLPDDPQQHRWSTTEHGFQADKYLHRPDLFARFVDFNGNAAGSKRLAREIGKDLIRPDWHDIKVERMACLLDQKFKDPLLFRKLLATYPRELLENNWWHDRFWGHCTCPRCDALPYENHLGKLLVALRERAYQGLYKPEEPYEPFS